MTLLVGQFRNSGRVLIPSGVLRVRLDAPLADTTTDPDSYLLPISQDFAIANGVLAQTVNLKESASANVSYTLELLESFTDYEYFEAGTGVYYGLNDERPTHLYSDGKYYSGVSHTPQAILLERLPRTRLETIGQAFQTIIPNQTSVEFASLEKTGFATDRTPQTARQVADALKADPTFMQSLIDFLVATPYSNTKLYRRGNLVTVGGAVYQALIDNTVGFPPASSPTQWLLWVSKGEPGGTGGQNDTFGAGWDGDLNAPSKNTIYDYLTAAIATKAELDLKAALASPNFTGSPTAPTPTGSTGIANKGYVDNAIASTQSALNANFFFFRCARFIYDFSVSGGTAGTTIALTPAGGAIVPGAVITGGFIDIITAVAANTPPNLSLGINGSTTNLRATAASTAFASGRLGLIPAFSAASSVKIPGTATGTALDLNLAISGTAPTNNLIAGRFYVVLLFAVTE